VGLYAKGTVILELKATSKGNVFELLLSPAKSSSLTVDNKECIVFIDASGSGPSPLPIPAWVWPINTRFVVPDDFQSIVIAAAASSVCVQLEIESSTKLNIVGVLVPAPSK
jgi:hypothetical protein